MIFAGPMTAGVIAASVVAFLLCRESRFLFTAIIVMEVIAMYFACQHAFLYFVPNFSWT
jgi:hypothetical protein